MINLEKSNYELNKISEIKISYEPYLSPQDRWQVRNSDDAYTLFRTIWNMDTISFQEEFLVAYLNVNRKVKTRNFSQSVFTTLAG